ncbi:hypothetical protein [Tsuneonella amylolytica]|uniref:hypothetical protein n=1 Tax=Tsuneonella amylolytica TaxID=2338327 RepID=UPI000EA8BBE2|nr:hypothetical protein [Tsuneonella amylolytica]
MSDKPSDKTGDGVAERATARAAAKAPVSAHPAFPAIVGLWFAALFGMGSLVLPVAIYEQTASATGIASVWTAAQAPLGVTARILISLVAAAAGVLAGLAVARKVAAASPARPMARRAAALSPLVSADTRPAKRPISAHEELGEGGLDAAEKPKKRRALSVTDDSARSEFLDYAPVPGNFDYAAPEASTELDLAHFAQEAPDDDEQPALEEEVAFEPAAPEHSEPEPFEDLAMTAPAPTASAPFARPFDMPLETPEAFGPVAAEETVTYQPEPEVDARPVTERPLGDLAIAQLVERFALALEGHRAVAAAPVAEVHAMPAASAPQDAETPTPVAQPAAPFDDPFAAPAAAAMPAALRPMDFGAFGEDEDEDDEGALPDLDLTSVLSRSVRAFAPPSAPAPSTLGPAAPTAAPAFVAPPAVDFGFARPGPAAFADPLSASANSASEDDAEDEGYSSLLAMKSPFGLPREAVRVEDEDADSDSIEPVVIFPHQADRRPAPATDGPAQGSAFAAASRPFDAPAARLEALDRTGTAAPAPRATSGETERALREALEKLQRMSGAA